MKVVTYIRVSSVEQSEGFSLAAQQESLHNYAKAKGMTIVEEFVETESAKKAGRLQFGRMVEKLKRNKTIKAILVEKTDRLYRNFKDYVDLDVDNLGIEIHFVKEGMVISKDSQSSHKLMHGFKVLIAKNFIDNLSEETRKGMKKMLELGGYPFMAPMGYKNEVVTRHIIHDEEYAHWVVRAFELFVTGSYSLSGLNEKLFSEGFRAKRSKKKPNKESMRRILTNPFYTGRCLVKGVDYQLNHTPLVSKEDFVRAQELLGHRLKPKMNTKNLPFSSLMKCGHCGRSITGEEKRKKNGTTYIYYHCTGVAGLCKNVTYLEQGKIMSAFDDAIKNIQIPENILELTKIALLDSHKLEKEFHDNAIKGLNLEYANIQIKIDACYEDKLNGNIDQQFWERKTGEWKRMQQHILDSLANHKSANSRFYKEGLELLELSKNAYRLYSARPVEEKREMINLVLSNCKIKDGSVCFDYRKPFDLMVKGGEMKKWGG